MVNEDVMTTSRYPAPPAADFNAHASRRASVIPRAQEPVAAPAAAPRAARSSRGSLAAFSVLMLGAAAVVGRSSLDADEPAAMYPTPAPVTVVAPARAAAPAAAIVERAAAAAVVAPVEAPSVVERPRRVHHPRRPTIASAREYTLIVLPD